MFRFKQFTIHQDRCAMKVCTDACLLGAWVAGKIESGEIDPQNIFDIGSGTGLLSLMLAQKSRAHIDAVEIDRDAVEQSEENIAASPWAKQVTVYRCSAIEFTSAKQYDLIICNPPFYENQLKSGDDKRNIAMHAAKLSFAELSGVVKNNLSAKGKIAVLLPYDSAKVFEASLNKYGLFIAEKLNIAHSPAHSFFRSVLFISFERFPLKESAMFIKDSNDRYSGDFVDLLKEYYLSL